MRKNVDREQIMNLDEPNEVTAAWLEIVRQQVGSVRFGIVQIVVHEGQVVQIERTEKVRLPAPSGKSNSISASASAES